MAVGDLMDKTSGAGFIPEVWADSIYSFFFRANKLRNSVDDYSSLVSGKGDKIHIPAVLLQTAQSKTGSAAVAWDTNKGSTPQAHDVTAVELDVNTHIYQAEIFEDILTIQAEYELISKYARAFGESLARKVETDIWAELDGFQTTVTLTADDAVAAADMESILANLYDLDIDPNQCSMAVNHLILADLLNPAAGMGTYFTRADAIPSTGNAAMGAHVSSGAVGLIYGMDVFFSQAIGTSGTERSGAVYVPGACAFAASQDVRVQSDYSVDYLGTKVIADMIYGAKLLDSATNKLGLNFVNAS
tara:strand:- start:1627 stop:2535 length:909 start_codon:yes stop_codon:yes gene_type:complete